MRMSGFWQSRNMRPLTPRSDLTDMAGVHAIPLGERGIALRGCDYVNDLCGFKARKSSALALEVRFWASLKENAAAFGALVRHVVGLCAKEKMIRIDAPWVVAPMANTHPGRNWASVDLPSNTIGAKHFPVERQHPVPPSAGRGPTQPAARKRFRNGVMVKAFSERRTIWQALLCYGGNSHSVAPVMRWMVRVGSRVPARFRPANFYHKWHSAAAVSGAP